MEFGFGNCLIEIYSKEWSICHNSKSEKNYDKYTKEKIREKRNLSRRNRKQIYMVLSIYIVYVPIAEYPLIMMNNYPHLNYSTDDIDGKLEELQQQLLIQAKSKNDYEDVADEIYRLRELKQNALVENAEREGKRQRIAEMTDFLNKQSAELEEYDEQLVRRLIEKVTIYEDKLTVEFKSGIEIDEEI